MTTAVEALRTASRERLADAALPTSKTEEWRFTELSSLVQVSVIRSSLETDSRSQCTPLPTSACTDQEGGSGCDNATCV